MRRLCSLSFVLVLLLAAPAAARAGDVATITVSGGALTVTALPGKVNTTVVVNPSATGQAVPSGTYFVGDQSGTVARHNDLATKLSCALATTQGGVSGYLCTGIHAITEDLGDGDDTGVVSDLAGSTVPSTIDG